MMNGNPESPRRNRRGRVLLLVAVAAAMAWVVWAGWFRDNLIPRNFGVIEEGQLYRSARLTPAALASVQGKYRIKTIVDLGAFDKDPKGEEVEKRTAAALGMTRYVFPLEGDGTGNPNAYVQALHIMADPSKRPVLVHCATGSQRTGAAAMLYGRIVADRPVEELDAELRKFGHDPARNTRLGPYLGQWTDAIKTAFRSGVCIDGFPTLAPDSGSATATVVIPVRTGRAGGPRSAAIQAEKPAAAVDTTASPR